LIAPKSHLGKYPERVIPIRSAARTTVLISTNSIGGVCPANTAATRAFAVPYATIATAGCCLAASPTATRATELSITIAALPAAKACQRAIGTKCRIIKGASRISPIAAAYVAGVVCVNKRVCLVAPFLDPSRPSSAAAGPMVRCSAASSSPTSATRAHYPNLDQMPVIKIRKIDNPRSWCLRPPGQYPLLMKILALHPAAIKCKHSYTTSPLKIALLAARTEIPFRRQG
jgi:hypothetical protein